MADPVLLTLLALFIACIGYVAGRLHQWYRTGQDRDEAYRDGYDAATRSTLSLAARIVGPGRDKSGVRASAAVYPSPAAAAAAESPAIPLSTPSGRSSAPHAPSVQFPRPSSPSAAASAAFAPSVSRRDRPTPSSPPVAVPPVAGSSASPPAISSAPDAVSCPAADAASSPASGGSSASAAGTSPVSPRGASAAPGAGAGSGRSGRHLVPDELVRAATYRLASDRVARAKVRGAGGSGDSPEEPGPSRSVPKPRSS